MSKLQSQIYPTTGHRPIVLYTEAVGVDLTVRAEG